MSQGPCPGAQRRDLAPPPPMLSQFPLRSGLPSGIRGVAVGLAAGTVFWAAAKGASAKTSVSAIAGMRTKPHGLRFMACPPLVVVRITGPRRDDPAGGHPQLLQHAHRVAAPCGKSRGGHMVARLESSIR